MDQQKKQKVILALVAVLVLGAGTSFWFFGRESDGATQKVGSTGPVERRERAAQSRTGVERKRRTKTRVEKAPEKARVERKVTKKKSSKRRTRSRGSKKVKKKKLSPAA